MSDSDPENRDFLLQQIAKMLPTPVCEEAQNGDPITLIGGEPGEVVVRIIGGEITAAEYAVQWEGHIPVVRPNQLATLDWKQLPDSQLSQSLQRLIKAAREIRRAKYRTCELCGETKPPEWMHDGIVCQSCAQRELGVVY